MSQTILYYPTINIDDGQWLRSALLYWDNISSIVPYENYADISPELLYLQNEGIYEAIYPQTLFYSNYADEFCDDIVKRISKYEEHLKTTFSVVGKNPHGDTIRMHKDKIYAPALYELIHYKKMPPKLLYYFKDKKYVDECGVDDWISIDRGLAHVYMKTLAEYSIKCSNKDIVLGSDMVCNRKEIYNNTFPHITNQCCSLNINDCLPQPSLDTSFEDIIDFKSRHQDELIAFRSKIRELEKNIYRSLSVEEIKHHEQQFIENWQYCTEDYYKALKSSKIKFHLNNLLISIGLPFVDTLLTPYVGQAGIDAIKIGSSLLKLGINYIDHSKIISPSKSDGGFSYVVKAKKNGILHE